MTDFTVDELIAEYLKIVLKILYKFNVKDYMGRLNIIEYQVFYISLIGNFSQKIFPAENITFYINKTHELHSKYE